MAIEFALAPRFEAGSIENRIYDFWLEKDIFKAERDIRKKPYTIMIPPPNVTGQLHLGHALNNTLQDSMIRYKRMQGFNCLWLPGTDHAGIATQAVVERKLYAEEGKTREDLGREDFLARIWDWKEEYGGKILQQMRDMGASCDWSRTRFTMDEGLSKAVRVAFCEMYNKDLIYRGARIVNWDCALQTAVSDDEIEFVEEKGMFAYMRYPIVGQEGKYIEVATTRPETMFGDTGVVVHPDDERYKALIGKKVKLPLTDREIPIVADDTVDPKLGTGAVKCTPGHDKDDYERGARAGLEILIVLEKDGTLKENCGEYAGLDRYQARKRVIKDLEAQGLLAKVEDHVHNVPQSDRSKTVIEPLVSEQWFVKMRDLAQPAIDAVKEGEVKFTPSRFEKIYLHWLENVHDWCISRQLWWGHRIPVYYDEDGTACASVEEITTHPETGKPIVRQDEDVLDTWFSSALWPFSTLGWPEKTADLDYYYPTNTLFTARDIIYLWVARMVIQGESLVGKKPFSDVFIHPTILDEKGKRMSKSAGNGVDPSDMIERYGVDSMRFSLAGLATDNQDCRLNIERAKPAEGEKYGKAENVRQFESARNFVNKVWNASRFALGNLGDMEEVLASLSADERKAVDALEVTALEDRWMLSRMAETIVTITDSMERYRFHDATQAIYHFIWDDVCDWYLEVIKSRLYSGKGGNLSKALAQAVLTRVLDSMLKMLHPFAPFVTEEIWQALRQVRQILEGDTPKLSIQLDAWPKAEGGMIDKAAEEAFSTLQELIRGVRNIRAEQNIAKKKAIPLMLSFPNKEEAAGFDEWQQEILNNACRVEPLEIGVEMRRPDGASSTVIGALEAFVTLTDVIDVEMEKKRLVVKIEKLKGRISGLKRKLENPGYVAKAPEALVEETREMVRVDVEELSRLEKHFESLATEG